MKTTGIYTQHEENKEWLNTLSFYSDEIKVLEGRLGEVVLKNNSQEIRSQIEHFQNQLIIQRDQIDRIKHEINLGESALVAEVNRNPVSVDHRKVADHSVLRDQVGTFKNIFEALRKELNANLSKWM